MIPAIHGSQPGKWRRFLTRIQPRNGSELAIFWFGVLFLCWLIPVAVVFSFVLFYPGNALLSSSPTWAQKAWVIGVLLAGFLFIVGMLTYMVYATWRFFGPEWGTHTFDEIVGGDSDKHDSEKTGQPGQ